MHQHNNVKLVSTEKMRYNVCTGTGMGTGTATSIIYTIISKIKTGRLSIHLRHQQGRNLETECKYHFQPLRREPQFRQFGTLESKFP
jgi:hypothetical protein